MSNGGETQRSERRPAVLATLADRNYIEPAKQLFASAYFNAGWRGDYLLLAHDIPEDELRWFTERGILVHRCAPIYDGPRGGRPSVYTSKFYLFTDYFRRWRTVVFTDADATIRASLDELCGLDGFWSIRDVSRWLVTQVVTTASVRTRGLSRPRVRRLIGEVRRRRSLASPAFCAGFFAFSTDLIEDDTFARLNAMMERYHSVSEHGDQLTFNLFFGDRWQRLPPVYNIQVMGDENQWSLPARDLEAIVVHYITERKPWVIESSFSTEWRRNYSRADAIDLLRIPPGNRWPRERIREYSQHLDSLDVIPAYWRFWANSRLRPYVPESIVTPLRPAWRRLWQIVEKDAPVT